MIHVSGVHLKTALANSHVSKTCYQTLHCATESAARHTDTSDNSATFFSMSLSLLCHLQVEQGIFKLWQDGSINT
jgi:hypothetical protein